MHPILPTEYMKLIFHYIKKDDELLYFSLLVNRYWCKNVVTLLWACPFDSLNFHNIYKITPVYISSLEENEKNQLKILLVKNLYDQTSILKLIPINKPLFSYSIMLEEFSLKSLEKIVQSWITLFRPDKSFEESRKHIMNIKEQIILFLFKLFIKSTNLKFLKIDSDQILNYCFDPDLHTNGQFLNISKLEFGYAAQHMLVKSINFIVKISKLCKKINNLIVKVPAFGNSPEIKNSIILIINAQEKLKEFSLRSVDSWLEEIIEALQSQANSLVSFNLECVNISESSLISLAKCKNLKNLIILNYPRFNIRLRKNIKFKNLKRLYIKNPLLLNINMLNLKELTLEVLTYEMMVLIIENCPNITHFNLKNYRPSAHDLIFKDFIQKLHITHLTIKFLYSNSIISESSILSKEFLPLSLKYLFVPSVVSFNTSIDKIASLKVFVLQGPCTEITSSGEYSNGSTFAVSQITSAEPLCLSDVTGVQDTRGSSVWFLSPKE
ncbi:16646_t:CDS:2 [Gigaspora margarita]|uniref:16646_t:CDS:1 n=1 Tax=Gigaspora margarita TaxID=4874 RepID=A0ABN7UB82_GIGMA|nr:16646_t:CDS:2 [Gigaspora margarita]